MLQRRRKFLEDGCKGRGNLGSDKTCPFQAEQKLIKRSKKHKEFVIDTNRRDGPNVIA